MSLEAPRKVPSLDKELICSHHQGVVLVWNDETLESFLVAHR